MAGGGYETASVWGDTEGGDAWDFFPWPHTMQTIHLPIITLLSESHLHLYGYDCCVVCDAQAGAAEHTTDLGN